MWGGHYYWYCFRGRVKTYLKPHLATSVSLLYILYSFLFALFASTFLKWRLEGGRTVKFCCLLKSTVFVHILFQTTSADVCMYTVEILFLCLAAYYETVLLFFPEKCCFFFLKRRYSCFMGIISSEKLISHSYLKVVNNWLIGRFD